MPASPRPSDPDNPTAQKRNGPPGKKMGATDKQTGMDGKDFAKAIGINKPANVRDKIKRWQQDIEPDVATTPAASTKDPATQDATPAPAPKPSTTPKSKPLDDKPNWKPAHERGKSVGASPERPGAAKKTPIPHNELDEDVLTATAPKKRVISDSHWRSKQLLPKENAGRPQPKTIPNAWVRPSRIIPKKPASPELKPIAPVTPVPNPLLPLAEYIGKSTGQIKPPPKQRRPSKPSSSGSDQRPTSSGGGSGKGTKSEGAPSPSKSPKLDKDKTELVRVRPSRRRARTSPRGSMSADDLARFPHKPANKSDTALSEDPNLVVTVEYEEESAVSFPRESRFTSPRNEELRERRRRRRPRSQGDRTADEALRSPQKPSRRKSRRSYPRTEEEAATPLTIPAVLDSTPTKPAGSRLEAWLSMTPDPLAEPKSRPRRRRSKTSVSSTESPSNLGTSEVTLSTEVTEEASVKKTRSRRRRKSKESASSPDLSATAGRSEVTTSTHITKDEPVKESHKRRASKDSVSSLDLPYPANQSNVSASTERTRDESVDKHHSRSSSGSGSGSGSRRRRRRRSRRSSHEMTVKTQDLEEAPSTVTSDTMTETTVQDKESEVSFASSPSLKRRGARRSQYSPTKGRSMSSPLREAISIDDMPKDESPDKDADSAAPTSPVDDRLSDLMPKPLRPRQILGPRKFPSRGKRLSTIASESARSDAPTALSDAPRPRAPSSEVGSFFNPETSTIISRQSTRRRKLARHEDLMSVLSMPKATGSKSIVSARSIRTNRSRLANATVEDIMNELASDEAKYMRELRTLVDGVIPVLLSCVLNKSEAAIAAGLFSRSKTSDPSEITKPIVDMGVCLERLKSLHKRVPKEDSDELISWAQSAQRVYSDYISVWRLGFQDVVISLAPADEDPFKPAKVVNGPDDGAPWDEGMPRNAEGYVVNSDGERVDVAYMLKRPLVRLKYLSKSLKGINYVQPSERVEKVSSIFQDLVIAARKRSNDEQARLEDEAAANIDPTRARDPRSLAPLAGVRVDPTRCVRARDHFDLHLYHSSGQEISCRVEILLRDNAPGQEAGGDILICEVDSTGRWLLLPPVQLSNASARNGDVKGEIFVMIRGNQADGSEWSEVMSLISDDEQAGFEWVQMLGLHPIPPQMSEIRKIQAATSEAQRPSSSHGSSSPTNETRSTLPDKSRTPSPHEIDIPIGEQHTEVSKVWHYDTPHKRNKSRVLSPITSVSGDGSVTSNPYDAKDASHAEPRTPVEQMFPTSQFHEDADRTPRGLDEAVRMANTSSPSSLKRTRAKRLSKNPSSPHSGRPSRQITLDDPTEVEDVKPAEEPVKPRRKSTKRRPQSLPSTVSHSSKGFSVWMPTSEVEDSDSDDSEADNRTVTESELSPPGSPPSPQRGQTHRRVSSVPSLELPSIPRQRKSSQSSILSDDSYGETENARETTSTPHKMHQKKHSISVEDIAQPQADEPPPPTPPHRSPSPASPETLKGSKTPVLVPTLPGFKIKRRSSSPLKHEYEPSTCTEESSESEEDSESEEEVDEEAEESVTSESSEDELDDDVPMPLMPIGYIGPRGYSSRPLTTTREASRPTTAEKTEGETKKFPKVSPPPSIYTLPNGTITPSQSASNSPYRTVPQNSGKASRTVASLFAWSEQGKWDSLHPDECSVVITPGKIEVFEISSNHSKPFLADGDEIITPEGSAPLVAVELTPLVPLRKSTAIDISIRSPPTAESRLKPGNNIMLRSRNAAECTQLYSLINQSRINNPTYIALQNARGPYGQPSWAEAMDRQNAARASNDGSSGWLGGTLGRRSSYRKSSTRAASISAATESSVGTMNSALRSALGRFSFGKSGVFSIRNSTLGSRSTGSSFDSGSNSRPGSGASTPNGDLMRAHGAPPGITETKCRLYERESLKKWRDMGSARLTIMLPSPNPSIPSSPTNSRQRAPGTRDHRQERRIVLTGKKHGEVLLDVQLSETCFERVARSGIAVSVWEDNVDEAGQIGGVSKTGGVLGARARIFMIQMKSERECAYCFSLLGKLRY